MLHVLISALPHSAPCSWLATRSVTSTMKVPQILFARTALGLSTVTAMTPMAATPQVVAESAECDKKRRAATRSQRQLVISDSVRPRLISAGG